MSGYGGHLRAMWLLPFAAAGTGWLSFSMRSNLLTSELQRQLLFV
jgi:hypothetical protein